MAKPIMIQGTMSNAGKSLVTAGLCRILRQDGLRVAPFKSQNMALNSFITSEGLEMGRAQVMQAEAAGVEPSVRMNPILLKPTSDSGSQVIVNGEVLGNYSAKEYFAMKGTLVPHILSAYGQLAQGHDVIVIEGAGSPAEINLKAEDIVNMGMAKMAHSPVLLVGDIDRGGVFASIYGTIALLEPEERAMVKGILINKFRGDVEILRPGLKMLEDLTGIPVVGVIPYLHVDIDDEDSLSQRLDDPNKAPGLVEIAIIRLPRISNFTDFNRLEQVPGVTVRYVSSVRELGSPDLVILPGTKNTMGDLLWLRQTGLEAAILKLHSAGCPVIGICGGYQMLGQYLHDPEGFEAGGEMRGLGLLPVTTIFEEQKVRTRVRGVVQGAQGIMEELAGAAFYGYEIHMGRTVSHGDTAPLALLTDETDGSQKTDGLCMGSVYGTYVHGFFDSEEVVRAVASALFRAKGLTFTGELSPDYEQYKNQQYDKLAEHMRASVDMQAIYRILEEGL